MTESNRLLANRYQVGELIGRGGMAEVHIGYDTRLGRTVAIKILRPDLARDPSFQTRFRREAQAAAGLNHPAIVAVYDTGEESVALPTGERQVVPFIVMEYVEGHTVRDILKEGAAAPIDEAVEILSGVLTGLEYAHAAGLVHRDIKPANIMLTPTGAVKVMDFGIARALADVGQTMTQAQAVVGTAQYLSPEQARGENVDARSDLYSAGCVLFELLCGRPPFVGDSPVSVAYQHVREAAPSPSDFAPDVPPALDLIVRRALTKDRGQRYSSAHEFLGDLNAFMAGRPLSPTTGQYPVGSASTGAGASAVLAATSANPGAAKLAGGTGGAGGAGTPTGGNPLDEYVEVNDRGRRIGHLFLLIATVTAAVAAVMALFTFAGPKGGDGTANVSVPDVRNMTQGEALELLDQFGLVGSVEGEVNPDVEWGLVIRSSPAEGTLVEAGSTVTIYVSVDENQLSVPDVRGLSLEEAQAAIENAGLVVAGTTEVNGDLDIPAGFVTGTDPGKGLAVEEGAEITIKVSSGKVMLQDLKGRTQEQAITFLESIRLPYEIEEVQNGTATPDTIIGQSPIAGLVDFGTGVILQVAIPVNMVIVPDVVGDPEASAVAQVRQALLQTKTTSVYSTTVAAGLVISTSPSAGTSVAEGTTVTLTISLGPEPPPSPAPSGSA
ncbi:MAG: Stk1 family PASTA domain-containing Ser/Thr kinase [Demequinaceae bacterium]|nr:Stk1 family PASTA domain-containing Ser/Thr kinase [Demequinaceae bacterium]